MPQAMSPDMCQVLQKAPGLTARNARANEATLEEKLDVAEVAGSSPRMRSEKVESQSQDEDLDVWIHSQFYARGGQKKKALQALSRHQTGTSVHQVPEVRKINSSTSRLGVKLEFYRDHTEDVDSLLRVVEEGFMCQESSSGEPLVNVAKVRSHGLRVNETDLLDLRSTSRPKSQASTRNSPRPWTPRAATAEQRSSAHSARLRDAVQRARDIQIEKRLEQALRLRRQQTRHQRAQRERPWITIIVVALSSMLLRKLVAVHRQIRQAICADVNASESRVGGGIDRTHIIRVYRNDFRQICVQHGEDLSLFTRQQSEAVQAEVIRLCDLELQRRQSLSIWTAWKKLLCLLVVYTRLRRPLRKAAAAEALKTFIGASSRAYLLRRAVKNFVRSVLLVQKAMRHQARIFNSIQSHILKPYVWCAETQALCDTCRVRKPEAAAKIEEYLEDVDLERWKEEVKQMMLQRARAWREEYMNTGPPVRSAQSFEDDDVLALQALHAQSDARKQMALAAATLFDSRASKRFRSSRDAEKLNSTRGPRKTLTISRNFQAMDRLRLDNKERDEVSRKVLLRIVDTWWNSFGFYAAQAERSKKDWINWRKEVLRHGSLDSRAPDPPEVLVYPEISFAPAYIWLQKEVENRLRERQDALAPLVEGA